jgi:REP element-mobilizing transposase RayT
MSEHMAVQSQNEKVPPASCRQACGLRIRHRGRLPHWEIGGGTYFVTFRLADSIPRRVADSYRFERNNIIKTAEQLKRPLTDNELERLRKLYSKKIENYLDKGIGKCYLRQHSIAQLTQDALEYLDNNRYRLYSWCIMPNHVHVVFQPFEGHSLDKTLHSWKSYTSTLANKLLNRSGAFWQREYYDHIIRNEKQFHRIIEYVLENPQKAGLKDWPWVKLYGD